MQTNLIQNPDLTSAVVTTYPGVEFGRGTTIVGNRAVFDGTGSAPYVTWFISEALIAGHTYSVACLADGDIAGTMHVATAAGPDSQELGTFTDADMHTFTFVATGAESGFTVTGSLHGAVASLGAPLLAE